MYLQNSVEFHLSAYLETDIRQFCDCVVWLINLSIYWTFHVRTFIVGLVSYAMFLFMRLCEFYRNHTFKKIATSMCSTLWASGWPAGCTPLTVVVTGWLYNQVVDLDGAVIVHVAHVVGEKYGVTAASRTNNESFMPFFQRQLSLQQMTFGFSDVSRSHK